VARASEALSGAAARLAGSAELRAPDAALAEAGDARGAGASRAAADPALAAQAAELLTAWCATVDALLTEAQAAPGEARGPSAILPWPLSWSHCDHAGTGALSAACPAEECVSRAAWAALPHSSVRALQ